MRVMDERGSVMDGRLRLIAAIAGMLFLHSSVCVAALPKPTHTNKIRFRIPFKFDSASLQRMNAKEVQLHVSRDNGATWELANSLAPDVGKFEYHAPAEGEYWFAVKTLDARNQLHPPRGSYETGLIVVVDNTAPTLDLTLTQIPDGKIQLRWKVTDTNLDSGSLRLEFLAPGAEDWEPIPILPKNSGETDWAVNQAGIVAVRGSVSDLAGNIGKAREQMNVNAGGRGNKLRQRGPVADNTYESAPNDPGKETVSTSAVKKTQDNELEYSGPIITPMNRLPRYSPSRESNNAGRERISNVSTFVENAPFATASMESTRAVQGPKNVASRPAEPFEPLTTPRPVAPRRSQSRQRIVSTSRFQLGYAVGDVGPSGVSGVELFITEDNGCKWWKYGDDPDQKSPFDVEVPRDGVYGFTIRARSGAGLSIGPPVANEVPETIVVVDQTPPVVELLPIEQGRGGNINKLRIRWTITEDNPSDLPVSLEYAGNLNGPWTPICGWREDTNHAFDWNVGPGVPAHFFIRVLARDAAGNVGKSETQQPVIVDLVQPTARIVDVEVAPGLAPQ